MSGTDPKTEKELKELLDSYRKGLQHWKSQLSSKEVRSQIKAAKVEQPFEELVKLCQLIHANTTKMGIIFTKPLKDINAAYKQTEELSSNSVLLVSLCSQLIETKSISRMYLDEVFNVIKNLLSSLEIFITELFQDEDDKRLVSVGKIWDVVSQLINISKIGKLGILKLKLKDFTTMITDGIEELEAWIEDPGSNIDDPFAFDDDEDEEDEDEDDKKDEDYSDILPDAKRYLNKIKLIKLLINSLMKSIPTTIKDSSVDEIYEVVKQYNEIVDELIYKIVFENNLTEANFWYKKSAKVSDELVLILTKINNKDDKRLKWIDTWQLKFQE